MALQLCDLANELLALIAEHLEGDTRSLLALRTTSSRFQNIAEPVLYRRFLLRTCQQVARLAADIESVPARAKAIQRIDAHIEAVDDDYLGGVQQLVGLLKKTQNLREFTFEMPGINERFYRYRRHWQDVTEITILAPFLNHAFTIDTPAKSITCPLPALKKLTLHMSGISTESRYWVMGPGSITIFRNPSIEDLTISCATILGDVPFYCSEFDKTPLKRLTFTECNVALSALHAILSMPRSLEYFYLGELANHRMDFENGCNGLVRDVPRFFAALQKQHHSLKAFYYRSALDVDTLESIPDCTGFSDFRVLERVGLECFMPDFVKLLTSETTKPPNLQTIEFRDYNGAIVTPLAEVVIDEDDGSIITRPEDSPLLVLCRSAATFKSLKLLEVKTPRFWHKRLEAATIETASSELKARGVRLLVSMRTHHGSVIPPYLYGEEEPTDRLIFDSDISGGWLEVPFESDRS